MRRAVLFLMGVGCTQQTPESPCALDAANPNSIDEALDRIDALPEPTIPCLVASLHRPLPVETTSGSFSAQPAVGERSPRVFIRNTHLTISIVPDGSGLTLVEFGEITADGRTIKAELPFPVERPVDRSLAFTRIAAEDGTVCGLCHRDETLVEEGRFSSGPLRPTEDSVVAIERIQYERDTCDPDAEPDRCDLLAALLDHGEIYREPFPDEYPTIFGP